MRFSLLYIIVNDMSLCFGLLAGQNKKSGGASCDSDVLKTQQLSRLKDGLTFLQHQSDTHMYSEAVKFFLL